jgi:hypothetical protein
MKKGDFVECLKSRDIYITTGSRYKVLAVEGDDDIVCGGLVEPNGFIIAKDDGKAIYCLATESCAFGLWELQ